MAAPTISKKQAKKTLAGKKTKKETIKNVLAKPYQSYWPLLSPEDNNQLKETLERLLPRLKNDKITVPYEEIKKVPKHERKNFRQNFAKLPPLEVNETNKQNLIFGVNDVSKLLEDRAAGCVLIASNVEPRLLVQHILDKAVLYSVPVLIVQDLRDILKKNCGISGAVIALKNTVMPDCGLGLIFQTVTTIYENYPVPQTHINYHRRLKETSAIVISDSEIGEDNDRSAILLSDSDEVEIEATNCHLIRGLDRKRAFMPDKLEPSAKQDAFIRLDSPTLNMNNNKTRYRPLLVKRVKADKNRNKRKMERFRKKLKK